MNKNATLMSHLQNAAIAVLTVTAVLLLIQTPLVGDLAGKTPYELAQDWLAGDWFRNVPPRGESFADSEARLLRGLDELLSRKDDTICVCHGGTILTAMANLFPEEGKDGYVWQPKPGFGYEIDLVNHVYLPISG